MVVAHLAPILAVEEQVATSQPTLGVVVGPEPTRDLSLVREPTEGGPMEVIVTFSLFIKRPVLPTIFLLAGTRGAPVIIGTSTSGSGRPMVTVPAPYVPEELVSQAQVVLQGKSRSLIIRELQVCQHIQQRNQYLSLIFTAHQFGR